MHWEGICLYIAFSIFPLDRNVLKSWSCVGRHTHTLLVRDSLIFDVNFVKIAACFMNSGKILSMIMCSIEISPYLDTWASEWCTTFNASKSAHMLITGNRRLRNFSRPVSSLSISGDVIPLVRSTVHLGICLSSTLSWPEHVTRLIHRVQFKVFTLKRLARRLCSESLVTRLFLSLVRPSLEYAAPA